MIFKNVVSAAAPENNHQLFDNYTIDGVLVYIYAIHYNNRNESTISYLGGSDVFASIVYYLLL